MDPDDLARVQRAIDALDARARQNNPRHQPATVLGISVGGCVRAHDTERVGAMRYAAHAHCDRRDVNRGWICVKGYRLDRLIGVTGKAKAILAHEYAHLLAPSDHGHGAAFRRAVTSLGHPAEARRYEEYSAQRKADREWRATVAAWREHVAED